MNSRNYKIDNIRFFLILLVVFGHLLELVPKDQADRLYRLIYTFHMPCFIFITGYFAKFDPKKLLFSLIYPYFLFQTLYLLFQGYVLTGAEQITLSFTTPYWLLWYLLAVILYHALIPFIQGVSNGAKAAVFLGAAAVSLLAGMDKNVGYYLSLSRVFCFLPFFVAGFYLGHPDGNWNEITRKANKPLIFMVCAVILIVSETVILENPGLFSRNVLYGSYSYSSAGYHWIQRLVLQVTAFAWLYILFAITPKIKLPIITLTGQNSLPIFLFHGFVVRLLAKLPVFRFSQAGNLLLAFAIALILTLLLGSPISALLCKWGFTGHWILALLSRKKQNNHPHK